MQLGFVGLGRMGANMVQRLVAGGHQVVACDRSPEATAAAAARGARAVEALLPDLASGDLLVDGGNSFYRDSMRRAAALAERGLLYVDAGTSGGVWGLAHGYCLMVGGTPEAVARIEPALKTLAPDPDGYLRVGPPGAGHFVKMIHNGIEYALLQAIARLWNQGSVVRSWLLELAERALEKDPALERVRGYVEDSGMGRWTAMEAIDRAVPAAAITLALFERFRSRQEDSFGNRMIAALRNEFGGHAVKTR